MKMRRRNATAGFSNAFTVGQDEMASTSGQPNQNTVSPGPGSYINLMVCRDSKAVA